MFPFSLHFRYTPFSVTIQVTLLLCFDVKLIAERDAAVRNQRDERQAKDDISPTRNIVWCARQWSRRRIQIEVRQTSETVSGAIMQKYRRNCARGLKNGHCSTLSTFSRPGCRRHSDVIVFLGTQLQGHIRRLWVWRCRFRRKIWVRSVTCRLLCSISSTKSWPI